MAEIEAIETAVRYFFLSTEEVKVVAECVVVHSPQLSDQETKPVFVEERIKRVLAVISHQGNAYQTHEQGCLSIFKFKSTNGTGGASPSTELVIDHIIPIFGDFSILVALSKRNTFDLRNPSSPLTRNQPRTELRVTINPGHQFTQDQYAESITLLANDLQRLRSVLAECKRLKQIADENVNPATVSTAFAWTLPYLSTASPAFSTIPPDVRLSRHPLHTRLSPASAGFPGDDLADIQRIREEWIPEAARIICNKTKARHNLKIRLGTFNVNGKLPTQDLGAWVRGIHYNANKLIPPLKKFSEITLGESSGKEDETSDDPDVLVVSFQELDLSAGALLYSTEMVREDAWTSAIFAGLGEKLELYDKLASKQLVGMLIMVFAKRSLRECFEDIKTTSVGAGILGVMGNKGGTAIRLCFHPKHPSGTPSLPTVLTFVNSHLAAFDEMADRRHTDFHDLSSRLSFRLQTDQNGEASAETSTQVDVSVFNTDVLFWMGDLNYRIDLPTQSVRTLLMWPGPAEVNLVELRKYDQLRNAIREGKAFEDFKETNLTHLPTYRFAAGLPTDQLGYDISPPENPSDRRKPAWTDRILHVHSKTAPVEQLSYRSHSGITMSDHRPVSADFVVSCDILDPSEYETTVKKLHRQVLYMEEEETPPKVSLKPASIDFGTVWYLRSATKTLEVKNTGRIPCAFRFVPLEVEELVCPTWLRIGPMTGLLLPDESAAITLTIDIDGEVAAELNQFRPKLEVTLILHVGLGKDHFIPVSANYEPTCFANTLSYLTRLKGPIRDVKSADDLLSEEEAKNAPREVMRLVNYMMSGSGGDVPNIFTTRGDPKVVEIIRECLDTGKDFAFPKDYTSLEISVGFGEALLRLLESLTEPLIPTFLNAACEEARSKDQGFEVPTCFREWTGQVVIGYRLPRATIALMAISTKKNG
ncbi:DNase I-like protein [Thelephora ganbajun]|uniref:DNase I-like protein n=1 Tax=Thelephora ganbajun TaxID=370292 RepID=A0ACB6ZX11_THEGA|nr:DNase I-like protein [Thelephora ganbajun]